MRLVEIKEAAKLQGITERAIRKRFECGKIHGQFVQSSKGGGKNGLKLMVEIEDKPCENKSQGDDDSKSNTPDRYKINRGSPGCNIITPLVNGVPVTEDAPGPEAQAPSAPEVLIPPGDPGADVEQSNKSDEDSGLRAEQEKTKSLPSIYNDKAPDSRRIPESCQKVAHLRFALLQKFNEETLKNHRPKTQIVREFLDLYNTGLLLPEIHDQLGQISRATLYNWASANALHGTDGLIPQYGGAGTIKINDHEKNTLLTLLLHQNRLKINNAIVLTKEYLDRRGQESPSSPATLRRFINEFRRDHYDIWVLRREGEKALKDKVLPYAERDWRLLDVGQILVADGHKLNFQVRHPDTGKPHRASIVFYWDWKSAYPVGWEIMVEESVQCIASALRNAIITLGKIPRGILMDNGKAFKAKLFTADINLDDTELAGMFARLEILFHLARPYNAPDKPVERFIGTFSDQYERIMPSYIGASINDKPAHMRRNEKYAQSLHNPDVPTIQETNDLILAWRELYAKQPRKSRDNRTAGEIFEEGRGPGVDPAQLTYLMMAREIKTVGRNGVTWLGWHWYHPDMYGFNGQVVVHYSLSDLSQIYVSFPDGGTCVAEPVEKKNPAAWMPDAPPRDMEAVKEIARTQQKLKNTTKKLCGLLDTRAGQYTDWDRKFRGSPEVAEAIKAIEDKKESKVVPLSPFIDGVTYGDSAAQPSAVSATADEPTFSEHWQWYDHLQAKDPATYTEKDRNFLEFYITTSEYKSIYGRQAQGGTR